MRVLLLLLLAFSVTNCVSKYDVDLKLDPSEPLRVAVMPFYQIDDEAQIENSNVRLFQTKDYNAQFSKQEELPVQFVQQKVISELEKTNIDIVPQSLVASDLIHLGFVKGETYDYRRIDNLTAQEICSHIVCDAVLRGKITRWDQDYYIAESVSIVGFELLLESANDNGAVLFKASVEDSVGSGLSKGPTGYGSLILEPIKGLREGVIEELASDSIAKALQPIHDVGAEKMHETPAPVIIASTHSASDIPFQRRQAPLIVLATGSTEVEASFSIGEQITGIPMEEVEPRHYVGEYYPLKRDTFDQAVVSVSLRDQYGRETKEDISIGTVTLR